MDNRREFCSDDIGGEILSILTKGIYRDPLDTLREYIQNAIDAKTKSVELSITSDVVSIRDYGEGMTRAVAENAIRLGISEKSATRDVGFRGIGIYSAFHVCDRLEIHTRPKKRKGKASVIVFDFGAIRSKLQEEQRRRNEGHSARISLEKLLNESVYVDDDTELPLKRAGTLVMMLGLRGNVYRRLTAVQDVRDYLRAAIPLPFAKDFEHKKLLEGQFDNNDYRVVSLTLSVNGSKEELRRAYHNEMFTYGKGYGPNVYRLREPGSRKSLGFAWVCVNDARKVLPDVELRGLLIRKFGFAVGDRSLFSPFFARQVVNKRLTGEIIVTQAGLLPNAARSAFEPGPERDKLYLSFADLAANLSDWVSRLQAELKAQEELETISIEAFEMVAKISVVERDVDELLRINTRLCENSKRLKRHKKALARLNPKLQKRTEKALAQAQSTIASLLGVSKTSPGKRSQRIRNAKRTLAARPKPEELVHAREAPVSLLEAISAADIELPKRVRTILRYIDHSVFRERLPVEDYREMLAAFVEFLEEVD